MIPVVCIIGEGVSGEFSNNQTATLNVLETELRILENDSPEVRKERG
jgi:hypothetical protein